jgi:hypothetical protein
MYTLRVKYLSYVHCICILTTATITINHTSGNTHLYMTLQNALSRTSRAHPLPQTAILHHDKSHIRQHSLVHDAPKCIVPHITSAFTPADSHLAECASPLHHVVSDCAAPGGNTYHPGRGKKRGRTRACAIVRNLRMCVCVCTSAWK